MPRQLTKAKDVSAKQQKITFSDKIRAFSNFFLCLSQIATSLVFDFLNIGKNISNESNTFNTPVIPAGYAFSIWGLIYLFALFYSIDQIKFSKENLVVYRKVGWLTSISLAMCTLWQLTAKFVSFSAPTLIPMFILFISAVSTLVVYKKYESNYKKSLLAYFTVSTLAGWVSVALFANISSVLFQNNVGFNLSLTNLSALILLIAVITTLAIIFKTSNLIYYITVVWAFVAILVANVFINLNELIFYEIAISLVAVSLCYYISKN